MLEGFIAENNIQEKEKNLENTNKVVAEFEERLSAKVRRQEKLNIVEEKDFKRGELPGKYMVMTLYKWNNRKFEDKYLKKLKRNWQKQKSVFLKEKS